MALARARSRDEHDEAVVLTADEVTS